MKSAAMIRKRSRLVLKAVLLLTVMGAFAVHAVITVMQEEMALKDQWVQQNLLTASNPPPFSFIYGGQPSSTLLLKWKRTETGKTLDRNRSQHVLTWTTDGLQVRWVAVEYNDYPMVEWTVYLKNISTHNTPILQDIQGLDATFTRTTGPEFILNGIKGDSTSADSYEPYQITLDPNSTNTFAPESGKSSGGPKGWPYYNLQTPNSGVILAIGWPGQWASSFARDATNNLRIQAGQQITHLCLKPGEEIRTPLIAMLFWGGTNVTRAQNMWRHFYIAHIIPRVDGQPPSTIRSIEVSGVEADISLVKSYLKAGIKPDICWRDAFNDGFTWYPSDTGPYKDHGDNLNGKLAWLNTGTWDPDPKKTPKGFKPFSDWIHARGMKFMLWFEPERVGSPTSWLGKNHPEWLLHPGSVGLILNEGNMEAFNWLTNHIEGLIKSNGIDWYREDMNGDGPASSWRASDAPDRQGIAENFYVQGHLAYWDALPAMNPGLRIDTCASGGRRNDLETMRRAVPLLRSDFITPTLPEVVEGNQCQTYGLSYWLPWQGSESWFTNTYSYRSFYLPGFVMSEASHYLRPRTEINPKKIEVVKKAYTECKKIAPIMLNGDYYPLTPYSLADTVWMAWQFNRPDTGEGCVQVFRRGDCDQPTKTFHLSGLDPAAQYQVTNFDVKGSITVSGKKLMEKGLTIEINDKPGAVVITYQREGTTPGSTR